MTFDQLLPLLVALIGSAGLWTFLKARSENQYKLAQADMENRAEFNDTLRAQVDRMSKKLDKLADDKEDLLKEIGQLRHELGEAKATIKHLEIMLMKR